VNIGTALSASLSGNSTPDRYKYKSILREGYRKFTINGQEKKSCKPLPCELISEQY
jgi:hypothetical protein